MGMNLTLTEVNERMRAAEIAAEILKDHPRLPEFMKALFGVDLERYAPAIAKGYLKLSTDYRGELHGYTR